MNPVFAIIYMYSRRDHDAFCRRDARPALQIDKEIRTVPLHTAMRCSACRIVPTGLLLAVTAVSLFCNRTPRYISSRATANGKPAMDQRNG